MTKFCAECGAPLGQWGSQLIILTGWNAAPEDDATYIVVCPNKHVPNTYHMPQPPDPIGEPQFAVVDHAILPTRSVFVSGKNIADFSIPTLEGVRYAPASLVAQWIPNTWAWMKLYLLSALDHPEFLGRNALLLAAWLRDSHVSPPPPPPPTGRGQ